MNNTKTLISFAVAISLFASCKKEEIIQKSEVISQSEKVELSNSDSQIYINTSEGQEIFETYYLYAGQHIYCGSVTVSNDDEFVYLTYTTVDGWSMKETQVYYGAAVDMPKTNTGNPKVGNFPHKSMHKEVETYSYKIKRNSKQCNTIAAHTTVIKTGETGHSQEETAWARHTKDKNQEVFFASERYHKNGGSWATTVSYCHK